MCLWHRSRERLQFHLMWAQPYQRTHFRRDGMVLHDSLLRAPVRSLSQGSVPMAGLYHRIDSRISALKDAVRGRVLEGTRSI